MFVMADTRNIYQICLWNMHVITHHAWFYQLCAKLRNGFSPIVGICGGQQTGKSHLATWVRWSFSTLAGYALDPTVRTFYEPENALKEVNTETKRDYLLDEGGDILDSHEWFLKFHSAYRSMINTQAFRNNLHIIISPFWAQADKSCRVHADFLLHVVKRGHYKAYKFIKRHDADDVKYATVRKFLGNCTINMGDVPADIWERYKAFSYAEKEKIRIKRSQIKENRMRLKGLESLTLTDMIEASRRVYGG